MSNAGKNLTLLALVLLVSLPLCEVVFRLINGVPPFALTNFRETRAIRVTFNDMARYDSLLGFVHRDNLDYGGFQTAEYGIRRHSPEQTRARKGAVLVSGSSFTAGSDVVNAETWPAQLEKALDRPVENAAVGGYGADQVILRAEELLPILAPEIVLIEVMEATIQWVSYSVWGMPKPYFTLTDGKLVAHNAPVPRSLPKDGLPHVSWLKLLGGHSLMIDTVMSRIDADAWYGQADTVVRIQNDPINVTCALLQRLKLKAEERNIRIALVSLFNAPQIMSAEAPPPAIIGVERCARSMGFQLISPFDRLRALYREDPKNMEALFGKWGNLLAHYTPRGNREVAMVVAEALKAEPAKGMATAYQLPALVPGDGRNLFSGSETLATLISGTTGVVVSRNPTTSAAEKIQDFRINSSGGSGEHLVSLKPVKIDQGPVTLSLDVRLEGSQALRVQLLVNSTSGVLADFDLRRAQSATLAIGEVEVLDLNSHVVPLQDGWHRISVGGTFSASPLVIILQLKDSSGVTDFVPNGETILFRRLQLERGQSASAYAPTSGSNSPGFIRGDGVNLVRNSEGLKQQVGLKESSFDAIGNAATGPRVYRLTATGKDGEHFVGIRGLQTTTGPYTASVLVRRAPGTRLRLQLMDDRLANGVIGDFDLESRSVSATGMGTSSKVDANIEEAQDKWMAISVTGTLNGSSQLILQLLDGEGQFAFAPAGEALEMSSLQVERGQSASPYVPTSGPNSPGFIKGDGVNLVRNSEGLKQVGLAQSSFDAVAGTASPQVYRLAATGKDGEHFVGIRGLQTTTGPYTASVLVRRAPGTRLRLQLMDDRLANGVIGDFDLESRSVVSATGIGTSSKVDANIEEAQDKWMAISVTGTLNGSSQVILQLLDAQGHTAFAPAGEALELRALQVERGQTASPYRPSSGELSDAVKLQK